MQVKTRTAVALLSAAVLTGSAVTGVTAFGHNGRSGHDDHGHHAGHALFDASLAPSVPSDDAIHGVAAGGAPWVLDRGSVQLRRDGRLRLKVRGLVIPVAPGNGTPGPVNTINAALYCGADTNAAATTASVPISRKGNARIDQRVTLPATCLAPVILVHPNDNAGAYIAASGFRPAS
jgi:hypothetical protein